MDEKKLGPGIVVALLRRSAIDNNWLFVSIIGLILVMGITTMCLAHSSAAHEEIIRATPKAKNHVIRDRIFPAGFDRFANGSLQNQYNVRSVASGDARRVEDILYGATDELKAVRIGWHFNAFDAYKAGLEKDLPIVVLLNAAWCKYCWKMIDEVLTCPSINRWAGNAVFAYTYPETENAARAIMDALKIEAYPAVTVLKPNPTKLMEVGRVNGFFPAANLDSYLVKIFSMDNYPLPKEGKGKANARAITPLSKTPVNRAACGVR